jgi:uncharacterized membrane protein
MEIIAYPVTVLLSGYITMVALDSEKKRKEVKISIAIIIILILLKITGWYGILAALGAVAVVYGFERR